MTREWGSTILDTTWTSSIIGKIVIQSLHLCVTTKLIATFAARGRVFDLDLSAFQFGIWSPFPHIVPVLRAEETAFNGLCNRSSILACNMPDFEETVMGLMRTQVASVKSMYPRHTLQVQDLLMIYSGMLDQLFGPVAEMNMAQADSGSFECFWSTLKGFDF